MFGTKEFKEVKTKKFESDKKRKQYYAINNYYKIKKLEKNQSTKKDKEKSLTQA